MTVYKRFGKLEDLEAGLKFNKTALDATPPDHPDFVDMKVALAGSYAELYRRLDRLEDLEASLKYRKEALELVPEDHPELAIYQSALGASYSDYYARFKNLSDLDAALKYEQEALNNIPEDHPSLAAYQASLGYTYNEKYERLEDITDLENALKYLKASLNNTSENHPHFAEWQLWLAFVYQNYWKKQHNIEDLKAALQCRKDALKQTSSDHIELAYRYAALAKLYSHCYTETKDISDYNISVINFNNAINSSAASPQIIWLAAIDLARLHFESKKDISSTLDAFEKAVNALPDLLSVADSLSIRYYHILKHNIADTIDIAAVVAIVLNRFDLAVKFLDQGLSITHQQLSKLKEQHAKLTAQYPDQASDLKNLSLLLMNKKQLLGQEKELYSPFFYQTSAYKRNQLISNIRTLNNFQNFLLPASYTELSQAAENGPVILLTCTPHLEGSYAVIILKPEISAVSIKLEVSYTDANKKLQELRLALKSQRINTREAERYGKAVQTGFILGDLKVICDWLWKFVVEPIFQILQQVSFFYLLFSTFLRF